MAAWEDAPDVVDNLVGALRTFDWTEADRICGALVARVRESEEPFPEKAATRVLKELRRKRRVALIANVADALMGNGRNEAEIQRQYAQALIEQGQLTSAERTLQGLLRDPATPRREIAEAAGLLGRIYKQRYVEAGEPRSARQRDILWRALRFYFDIYRTNPTEHYWHGINAVALLARAERDAVSIPDVDLPPFRDLAREILKTLDQIEQRKGELAYWERATALEAHVALRQFGEAKQDLREYMYDGNTDAFECASTLRQLREVWQIEKDGEPGAHVTAGLQAALLKRSGGELNLEAGDVEQGLQLNFSAIKDLTFTWWKNGLERCAAVARVEDHNGRRVGTGFLVRRSDFLPDAGDGLALMTNWHVISDKGEHPLSIRPEIARANFEACGKTYRVKEMVAYSRALDASLVGLEPAESTIGHCPLEPMPTPFSPEQKPRVYVIGFPGGRGLSFSVHDSIWLDTDGTRLHYRTPTEPGSSGSPVFDQDHWTLIGLHHAGKTNMQRLRGQAGTYEANEGIAIEAIRSAFAVARKA
jgi:hypothetical protein